MADTFTSRTETSEESLEAAGLEVVVAAATTETAEEAQGLDVVVAATSTDVNASDDVWIDGNIITAENYDAARAHDGNDLLIVNNGDGSDFLEGGEGLDTVQVNGSNTAGDSFRVDPNGERVEDSGENGRDIIISNEGDDFGPVEGGAGNDFVQVNGANGAGDDVSIDPNGERAGDGGEGNDLLTGGAGNDFVTDDDVLASADTLLFTETDDASATTPIGGQIDFYHREYFETTSGDAIQVEDFWYQDYADTRDGGIVPTETISLNYEEIKAVDDAGFDAIFDAA